MAAPPLEFLYSYLWIFATFVAAGAGVIGHVLYRYWYEPPLARQVTKAKHSRGDPIFLENEVGIVEFFTTDRTLPEGFKHVKGKGWFVRPIRDLTEVAGDITQQRGPGRPPKNASEKALESAEGDAEVWEMLTHTPILAGMNKRVFFGSTTSVALTGLKAIAHADLRKTRILAPVLWTKTQLSAYGDDKMREGLKMAGREGSRILIYAIAGAVLIASLGIVAWLLTSHSAPAAPVAQAVAVLLRGFA